jgi:hypothetical protein
MNLLPALALATLISDDACSARLDHLLTLHREYGLPVPPPDASLVRCAYGDRAYLVIGPWSEVARAHPKQQGWSLMVVKPDPVALGNQVDYGRLDLAIKCHERGWRELARAAFRLWLARTRDRAERQLAGEAWWHWYYQIGHGAPLPVVAKHLKRVLPDVGFANEGPAALVRSLDLSLVPARSAHGSDDALIDALIEEARDWGLHAPAARALARRGFDAIPALIAHLGDNRLTRSRPALVSCDGNCFLRVKDLAYLLLCAFAGKELELSNDIALRTFAAGRWFADAQKMGEEKYVLERLGRKGPFLTDETPLLLLAEKYPKRLPEVYRRFLDTEDRSEFDNPFAQALLDAPIPRAEKLKVLEYAATHPVPGHRWVGFHFLRQIDPRRASELLIAALDRMGSETGPHDAQLARIIPQYPDPKVWTALAGAAKRVPAETRVELLRFMGPELSIKPAPACRRLVLAFLSAHLADDEVRDRAAAQLTQMLGVEPVSAGAAHRAHLRELVQQALEHDVPR